MMKLNEKVKRDRNALKDEMMLLDDDDAVGEDCAVRQKDDELIHALD
jgi:cell division protein FtsB